MSTIGDCMVASGGGSPKMLHTPLGGFGEIFFIILSNELYQFYVIYFFDVLKGITVS